MSEPRSRDGWRAPSGALNQACGPLVQDEVKQAKNLIGGITSLITGAGLLGIP
jgi:hypothetical protein